MNPVVFSTAGALLLTTKISSGLVGYSACIIFVSVFVKFAVAVVASFGKNWTLSERIFVGIC